MKLRGRLEAEKLDSKELIGIAANYENIRKLSPPRPGTLAHKWDGTMIIGKLLGHLLWLEEREKQIGKAA